MKGTDFGHYSGIFPVGVDHIRGASQDPTATTVPDQLKMRPSVTSLQRW
jgi:hypothetical protein